MRSNTDYMRAIMVTPEDGSLRHAYADWLDAREDPRAKFIRIDSGVERISYVDWLKKDGSLDYYVREFPEVKQQANERRAQTRIMQQLNALSSLINPQWLAFMTTLGCPFHPFYFWNNSGGPRSFERAELPFAEPIGTRGAVLTFQSAFRTESSWGRGLMHDLQFLCRLDLKECHFGAATCPIHPIICEIEAPRQRLTGADVIAALKASNFQSEHIKSLDATTIRFPGYHPNTLNDEIHNDFMEQHVFQTPKDEDAEEAAQVNEFSGTHGVIKRYVDRQKIWYALLHPPGGWRTGRYVVLFVVGRSPTGNRLVGVVTHQVCHNLCD